MSNNGFTGRLGATLGALSILVSLLPAAGCGKNRDVAEFPTLSVLVRNESSVALSLEGVDRPWVLSDDFSDFFSHANRPTCERIAAGEDSCLSHGDVGSNYDALAVGEELTRHWSGWGWRLSEIEITDHDDQTCNCMEAVRAPSGSYTVRLTSVTEFGGSSETCVCSSPQCVCSASPVDPILHEMKIEWPKETAVVFVLNRQAGALE